MIRDSRILLTKVRFLLTVKIPIQKTPPRIALFFAGNLTLNRRGIGIRIIMISEEILKTALVIRWWIAVEHCSMGL